MDIQTIIAARNQEMVIVVTGAKVSKAAHR